jgi:hypothetical protein
MAEFRAGRYKATEQILAKLAELDQAAATGSCVSKSFGCARPSNSSPRFPVREKYEVREDEQVVIATDCGYEDRFS